MHRTIINIQCRRDIYCIMETSIIVITIRKRNRVKYKNDSGKTCLELQRGQVVINKKKNKVTYMKNRGIQIKNG